MDHPFYFSYMLSFGGSVYIHYANLFFNLIKLLFHEDYVNQKYSSGILINKLI